MTVIFILLHVYLLYIFIYLYFLLLLGLARVQRSPEMEKKLIADTTALLKQDYREFECNTWHLEPTVR